MKENQEPVSIHDVLDNKFHTQTLTIEEHPTVSEQGKENAMQNSWHPLSATNCM